MPVFNTSDYNRLGQVYKQMQGENWSPNGDARRLIARRGLKHTSLSVGDVVVLPNDSAWQATPEGWKRIGDVVVVRTIAAVSEQ